MSLNDKISFTPVALGSSTKFSNQVVTISNINNYQLIMIVINADSNYDYKVLTPTVGRQIWGNCAPHPSYMSTFWYNCQFPSATSFKIDGGTSMSSWEVYGVIKK